MPTKRINEQWRNYNPLDKDNVRPNVGKSNRLPYSKKESAISLLQMVQPKVSSLGVLPSRKTEEVADLNVMLIGDSLDTAAGDQDPSEFAIEVKDSGEEQQKRKNIKQKHLHMATERVKMPAIISSEGTISAPILASRAKPPARPKPKIKKLRKKPDLAHGLSSPKEKAISSSRQSLSGNYNLSKRCTYFS